MYVLYVCIVCMYIYIYISFLGDNMAQLNGAIFTLTRTLKCKPNIKMKKWIQRKIKNINDQPIYGNIAFRGITRKSKAKVR